MRTLTRVLTALALLLSATPAEAQYFGRNSVQYKDLDFEIVATDHFDVYHYPQERRGAELAARMAERWYSRLSRLLDMQLPDRQPLILYASHPDFEQTDVLYDRPGEGTGGVTEFLKRRIVLPMAGPLSETDHVIGHELVHAFQFSVGGEGTPAGVLGGATGRMPLWFIEGMAEYLSQGPVDPHTAMWMRVAVEENRLPAISELDDPRYFPYHWGQAVWAYVAGVAGDAAVGRILKLSARGYPMNAMEEVTGTSIDSLSAGWHRAMRAAYGDTLRAGTIPASSYGPLLVSNKENGGDLNIAPAISPDGKSLVFLSERDLFSIELFLADAGTGRVRKTLSRTAVDPHFESLEFLESAGSWAPDNTRFAFGAISEGQPVIAIMRPEEGKVETEVTFEQLSEVLNPTWSPDGRKVAFSANMGGLLDLFMYDLDTRELIRLTDDAYAEIQPAWSPDGASIAFATDRFTTDLLFLDHGPFQLALLDVESRAIRPLPSFSGARNINPQWGRDRGTLFFLANPDGISNVFRLDIDTGRIRQITNLWSGVSGITDLSPALTVAAQGDRLIMSVFAGEHYDLYAIEDGETLEGQPYESMGSSLALLPGGHSSSEVGAMIASPEPEVVQKVAIGRSDYRPGLSLDYIGEPYLSIATSRLGSYVGGGATAFFSDMLGEHRLGMGLQVNGNIEGFGGMVAYENRTSRWLWGTSAGRLPLVTASVASGIGTVDGVSALVEETEVFTEFDTQVGFGSAYPFSRSNRIEMSATLRRLSYSLERHTEAWSVETGMKLVDSKTDLVAPDAINVVETAVAFVHDTSLFGATSPIMGRRARLEIAPTIGDISYIGALADLRQYSMPVRPITIASRLLHYGRYGRSAEDETMRPLSIGFPYLVRGYTVDSFDASDCGAGEDCFEFDRLNGSRVLVGNAEIRFPLLWLFGNHRLYGPLPVELGGFFDTGVAWSKGQSPRILGGAKSAVSSTGATARMNVGGYVIMQVDFVRPLDRPDRGWFWQFGFIPGF